LIGIFYVVTLLYPQWLSVFGTQINQGNAQFWIVATPVLIGFVGILGVGAWIGWTMASTPPPKPIEDITSADETKEAKSKEPERESKEA
jgi:predicted DNA-binding transcriptional regulator